MAQAVKAATKRAARKTVQVKDQPTQEKIDEIRKAVAERSTKEIKVQVTGANPMFDTYAKVWILDRPTLTVRTPWLDRQIRANKIKELT